MKVIQNTFIGFRCPNTLKEKMIAYADDNHIHVSQLIRNAVVKLLTETGENIQQPKSGWIVQK
jgi:hypothetical protein